MNETITTLRRIRRLRLAEQAHRAKAADKFYRACAGTSTREAVRIGGTGHCPLTDNVLLYTRERGLANACREQGDKLWEQARPKLSSLPRPERRVLFWRFNAAMEWADVANKLSLSQADCMRLCEGLEHKPTHQSK